MSERNFDYMDENGAKDEVIRLDAQVRELEAENARLSAELAKAREAMRKARNHATPFSGSFRQWHSEIVGILDAALAAKGADQ